MLDETLNFLAKCGLEVRRNGRNYMGSIPSFPEVTVVFQRQEDIVQGVESGLLTFGIAGLDLVRELVQSDGVVVAHDGLGFGRCTLEVAVPEEWGIDRVEELPERILRVASKFPNLTREFLEARGIEFDFAVGAGTLEVSPALGYSDIIVDLVSTGKTLADNRLVRLVDGRIMESQATFLINRQRLADPVILRVVRRLLEFFEGTLRAQSYVSVHANMRGCPDDVTKQLIDEGLQGPTVSAIGGTTDWFAIHIVVEKRQLSETIDRIRMAGGSGVVVSPVLYIFEEEPERFSRLRRIAQEVAL